MKAEELRDTTSNVIDLTTSDGKYRYVFTSEGYSYVFRNGEEWRRDVTGDKLVYMLASDLTDARKEIEQLRSEIDGLRGDLKESGYYP